jgi:biopolymer transport protein ExbD
MAKRFFTRRIEGAEEQPTVNLTPLIDVGLVILIMFILVAPLLEVDRIELADAASNPDTPSVAVTENSPITVHVLKDNRIMFNSQYVTSDRLETLLRAAKAKYPKVRPQIFHDKSAHFGTYQSVKNAVERAGFDQMDIVLKPSGG